MSNPYKPPRSRGEPRVTPSEPLEPQPSVWLAGAASLISLVVFAGIGSLKGAERIYFDELSGWVIFVFATLAFGLAIVACIRSTPLGRYLLNLCSWTLAITAAVFLTSLLVLGLYATITGIPNDRWVFLNRALGQFTWLYWIWIVGLVTLPLPLLFAACRSRPVAVSVMTMPVALLSAVFLRAYFIAFHDRQPVSSWSQFFWPF